MIALFGSAYPQLCLTLFKNEFIEITTKLSAVVACRCSPTQKADVARLIRRLY
jgi:phospholipid-translocating ATPase